MSSYVGLCALFFSNRAIHDRICGQICDFECTSDNWPHPKTVLCLAALLYFFGGVVKGCLGDLAVPGIEWGLQSLHFSLLNSLPTPAQWLLGGCVLKHFMFCSSCVGYSSQSALCRIFIQLGHHHGLVIHLEASTNEGDNQVWSEALYMLITSEPMLFFSLL